MNTKNGVEKSSSTPFSIDPIKRNAGQNQSTCDFRCSASNYFGSILNGVDDDFSTPFFVFTKYLRNAIK